MASTEKQTKAKEPKLNPRQIKSLKIVAKGKPISHALKEAGYSDAYAHNPHQFMESTAVKSSLERFLPREYLDEKLRGLVDIPVIEQFYLDGDMDRDEVEKIAAGYNPQSKVIKKVDKVSYDKKGRPRVMDYWYVAVTHQSENASKGGLDIAYKLHGAYAPDRIKVERDLEDTSDDELLGFLAKNRKTLEDKLKNEG